MPHETHTAGSAADQTLPRMTCLTAPEDLAILWFLLTFWRFIS